MKSHQINSSYESMIKLKGKINEELTKSFVTGYGYGAKTFAQTVFDIIHEQQNDEDDIISKIDKLVTTTLKNSPQQISEAFEEIRQRTENITGKE